MWKVMAIEKKRRNNTRSLRPSVPCVYQLERVRVSVLPQLVEMDHPSFLYGGRAHYLLNTDTY